MSKRRSRAGRRPEKRQKVRDVFVGRPFEGLVDEVEWVALRELVPSGTAPLQLAPEYRVDGREVLLATVLPLAWPAMTKPDGRVFLGLQRQFSSGDVSRDLAAALLAALATEPGRTVEIPALPGPGPRLQDVLMDAELDVTVHDGFEFWLDDSAGEGAGSAASDGAGSAAAGSATGTAADANVRASLERANESIYPTVRMDVGRGAYWCQTAERAHARWVLPEPEDVSLTALARLAAAGSLSLGEGTRFVGMFRAHGLLVPVWDLPREVEASAWEGVLADFGKRYAEALTLDVPLSGDERRARQGLLGRQLTLR